MAYKLKIGPSQGLKLKGQAGFALPMIGGVGIKATKSGGIWTVDLDYTVLTPGPVSDAATAYVAIEDKTAGIYREVSLASLLTSGLDADLQAIAALTSTGVLVRTADDTWTLRTVTGTANEITVTNGDGVSGNPTVSLPAALTFTGKTVTGGAFDGLTITTSTFNGNTWTAGTGTLTIAAGKTLTASNNATVSGTNTGDQTITLTGDVTGTGTGSFAATIGATKVTSAMLNADVFSTAHTWSGQQTFVAPALGTPASGVATNLTGTAAGLTAGNVTTNANLTGDVTSVGNATTIGAAKVTSAMLNADVFSSTHTWSGVQTFSAAPIVPTQSPSDNSTKAASTAYVDAQVAGGVAGVASIDGQTGAFTTDDSISSTSNVLRAQFKGHLYGLTLSNNSTDATNDIDIAAGEAAADGILMVLSSGLTKRLDAAWAVGTNQGGLDTGSIANTTYHVWLIQRSDTGVVDALFSTSATAPTMPTNYDRKRRIGSIVRASAAIRLFRQYGDIFKLATAITDISITSAASAAAVAVSVPTGVKVRPIFRISHGQTTAGNSIVQLGDADTGAGDLMTVAQTRPANDLVTAVTDRFTTNTSAQVVYAMQIFSGTVGGSSLETFGWIDERGRQ